MTSPNHTINSVDSMKLILTIYCATNRLRRPFKQALNVIYCQKSKLPCQKELNFRILIANQERDMQCMMNAHHMMDSHHMMGIHH